MNVELSRFKIKAGKSARVDEWLAMLNERMDEAVQTLNREQMQLEVIFREFMGGEDYLYWFSVQGEAGESVHTSPFPLDALHMAFFDECIDDDYARHDAQPQVVMVPRHVAQAMGWANPAAAHVPFERREIIKRRPSG